MLKERYVELWQSIDRQGVDKLLDWLNRTDFFEAPASTKHHLSVAGGLLQHSINVYECLSANVERLGINIPHDTIVVCGLGHDLCKANFYGVEMRNVKEDGVWLQKPHYVVKDQFPFGHGEKSAFILQQFMSLTREEILAIRWHMGGFTPGINEYSMSNSLAEAQRATPLTVLLHIADIEAAWLRECQRG